MAFAATFKDPATYAGEPICPCCGSGWPCCADKGRRWTHEETCARYRWSPDLCADCDSQFKLEAYAASTLPTML